MKSNTYFCTLLLFVLVSGYCTVSQVYAQNQSNRIGVSVNVVPVATETITLRDMDFSGLGQSLGTINIDPVSSERAGKMLITGTPNAPFRLSYLPVRLLHNQLGGGSMSFEYRVAGNRVDDQSTAELFTEESRELQFNDQGEFYIWIGGNIDFENASPGSYTGDFTLEIDYI